MPRKKQVAAELHVSIRVDKEKGENREILTSDDEERGKRGIICLSHCCGFRGSRSVGESKGGSVADLWVREADVFGQEMGSFLLRKVKDAWLATFSDKYKLVWLRITNTDCL